MQHAQRNRLCDSSRDAILLRHFQDLERQVWFLFSQRGLGLRGVLDTLESAGLVVHIFHQSVFEIFGQSWILMNKSISHHT
jgi:hypothetical protein